MDIALPSIFGLVGVLVGGVIAALIELWRQVLTGRAAARIVRLEIQEDINRCVQAVAKRHPGIKLTGEAWRDLRVQVAPLLPDEAVLGIATGYGALFIVEDWIGQIQGKYDQAKAEILEWTNRMMIHVALLKQTEKRSRFAQLVDLALGRATFPPPVKDKTQGKQASRQQRTNEVTEQ